MENEIMPTPKQLKEWSMEWSETANIETSTYVELVDDLTAFICKKTVKWTLQQVNQQQTNPFITGGRDID